MSQEGGNGDVCFFRDSGRWRDRVRQGCGIRVGTEVDPYIGAKIFAPYMVEKRRTTYWMTRYLDLGRA